MSSRLLLVLSPAREKPLNPRLGRGPPSPRTEITPDPRAARASPGALRPPRLGPKPVSRPPSRSAPPAVPAPAGPGAD